MDAAEEETPILYRIGWRFSLFILPLGKALRGSFPRQWQMPFSSLLDPFFFVYHLTYESQLFRTEEKGCAVSVQSFTRKPRLELCLLA